MKTANGLIVPVRRQGGGRHRRRGARRARRLVALVVPAAALALYPGGAAHAASPSEPVQSGMAYVDFDGDGRADYCRRVGPSWDQRVQCTRATSVGFGSSYSSSALDWGYDAGRAWADLNGDGRADYCRVIGGPRLSCTLSTGWSFGATYTSGVLDAGYDAGRAWVDFNGDGRDDYCRVVGSWDKRVQCTVSTGSGFGATYTSAALDPGYDAGRGWADFNGDGRADYCRVVGGSYKNASCTVSSGTGFGLTYTSGSIDPGYDAGRAWADFDGDRRADYCRVIGGGRVQCTPSTGTSFGWTSTSAIIDVGYDQGRSWTDFSGDGRADYCRVVGSGRVACTVSTGAGFGWTYWSAVIDVGYSVGRAWADFNGDGRAGDYCRWVGTVSNERIECSMSTGSGFGSTYTSNLLEWGYAY